MSARQDRGKEMGGGESGMGGGGGRNTVAGCDSCHMWGALLYEMPPSVGLCACSGVRGVQNPPANESALCRVRPYCLLRAGPFVSYC